MVSNELILFAVRGRFQRASSSLSAKLAVIKVNVSMTKIVLKQKFKKTDDSFGFYPRCVWPISESIEATTTSSPQTSATTAKTKQGRCLV